MVVSLVLMKKIIDLVEKYIGPLEDENEWWFSGAHDVIYFRFPPKDECSKELLKELEKLELLYEEETESWFSFS